MLVMSQLTLYGDTSRGRRPSWTAAAPAVVAEPLVDEVVAELPTTMSSSSGGGHCHLRIHASLAPPVHVADPQRQLTRSPWPGSTSRPRAHREPRARFEPSGLSCAFSATVSRRRRGPTTRSWRHSSGPSTRSSRRSTEPTSTRPIPWRYRASGHLRPLAPLCRTRPSTTQTTGPPPSALASSPGFLQDDGWKKVTDEPATPQRQDLLRPHRRPRSDRDGAGLPRHAGAARCALAPTRRAPVRLARRPPPRRKAQEPPPTRTELPGRDDEIEAITDVIRREQEREASEERRPCRNPARVL